MPNLDKERERVSQLRLLEPFVLEADFHLGRLLCLSPPETNGFGVVSVSLCVAVCSLREVHLVRARWLARHRNGMSVVSLSSTLARLLA